MIGKMRKLKASEEATSKVACGQDWLPHEFVTQQH